MSRMTDEQRALAEEYFPYAMGMANNFAARHRVDRDAVRSRAGLILCEAVMRFKPEKGDGDSRHFKSYLAGAMKDLVYADRPRAKTARFSAFMVRDSDMSEGAYIDICRDRCGESCDIEDPGFDLEDLDELPPKWRQAIIYRCEGYSWAEVARKVGVENSLMFLWLRKIPHHLTLTCKCRTNEARRLHGYPGLGSIPLTVGEQSVHPDKRMKGFDAVPMASASEDPQATP